jgi:hypothetical protein
MSLAKDVLVKRQNSCEALLCWLAIGNNREKSVLRRIAILLLVDAVSCECENKSDDPESQDFSFLWSELFASGCEKTDTFILAISNTDIDIESELIACEMRGIEIVETINANLKSFTFADMWKIAPNDVFSEILRVIGHGVSFWDNHNPEDYGQDTLPKVGWFESCYDEAQLVLVKLADYFKQ